MSTLGVIAEYNPFHNGHLYHLEQSRVKCGTDSTVCVMSGNFIQRGEPAIVDKWSRTKMALFSGVDLVLELPVVYAMSSAEFFAFGAVRILDSLGIVDKICFGSESGNIEILNAIANILVTEPYEYKSELKDALSKGISYPAAREKALHKYISINSFGINDLDIIIKNSNNILGIEYLKALKRISSRIKPVTIQRVSNKYNSEEITDNISSATAIRKLVISSGIHDVLKDNALCNVIPTKVSKILQEEFKNGRGPVSTSNFENIIISKLRSMNVDEIALLPYVSEGLENRIKSAAEISGTFDELIDNISTRRYTGTRIQRCLFSVLSGLKNEEFNLFNSNGGPQYIRVLGFNETGRKLLAKIKKNSTLPVIMKTADFKNSSNTLVSRMLQIEAASTDQYVLAYNNSSFRRAGQEFTNEIVRYI